MNAYIVAFLLAGALFGLASYPKRHLFSEGAARPAAGRERGFVDGRLWWTLQGSLLWPILLCAGAYGLACRWRARRR